jgi:hypothetical protein
MGAESLNTIQIAMVARWFSGAEMGMNNFNMNPYT